MSSDDKAAPLCNLGLNRNVVQGARSIWQASVENFGSRCDVLVMFTESQCPLMKPWQRMVYLSLVPALHTQMRLHGWSHAGGFLIAGRRCRLVVSLFVLFKSVLESFCVISEVDP